MTVKQLYRYLDEKIPAALSGEWDNDGLMCCPAPDREVRRVLIALDATAEVTDKAVREGYDLIVTHHPFIFKGLKHINDGDFVAAKAIKLIKADISLFSFHTRLDAAEGGVNDTLASLLDLGDTMSFAGGLGRIGTLPSPVSAEELAAKVKALLCADGVFLADAGKPCSRVAVLGGGGDEDVYEAMANGADTYITGDLKYHTKTDAPDFGINLIEAGHFQTENPVCRVLAELICSADESISCDIFHSNRTKLI